MDRWSTAPVLSGVSTMWTIGRNQITAFYHGRMYLPQGREVPCGECMVPHGNSSVVWCYDPWAKNARGETRFPIICSDCHNQRYHAAGLRPA